MRYMFYSGEGPGFGGYTILWHADSLDIAECQPEVLNLRLYDWQCGNDCVMTPESQWLSWRIVDHRGECIGRNDIAGIGGRASQWLNALDKRLDSGAGGMESTAPDSYRIYLVGELEIDAEPECQRLLEEADFHLDYVLGCQGPRGEPLPEARQGAEGMFSFYEREDGLLKVKTARREISA